VGNTAKLILGDDRPSQISTCLGDAASKQAETGESVITPANELSVSAQSWRREWTTTSATNWNDASRLLGNWHPGRTADLGGPRAAQKENANALFSCAPSRDAIALSAIQD